MTNPTAPQTTTWHKANPPFTRAQMADAQRSPSWLDEYTAMTGIASDLAYNETSPSFVVDKINALFGVSVPETNKTMVALVSQVFDMLSVLRPEWYDLTTGELLDVLPESIDHRSKNAIKVIEDAKLAAERKQRASEAALARREAERAAIAAGIAAATTSLGALLAPIIEALKGAAFHNAKKVLTEELPGALAAMNITNPYADQVVFAGLPAPWFKELADGTLKLRDALPKQKLTGLNRHQRAFVRSVYIYCEKHGIADTALTLRSVWPALDFLSAEMAAKEIVLPEIVLVEGDEPETLSAEGVEVANG